MSRLGAGCRQKPSSKAGSKQGGIISNSSTSKTKSNKKPAPGTASAPPRHLQRQAGALTKPRLGNTHGAAPRTPLGFGAAFCAGTWGTRSRGSPHGQSRQGGAASTGPRWQRAVPCAGGLAPCPRHYRHSSAIGRGSRAAWVRPRARFWGAEAAVQEARQRAEGRVGLKAAAAASPLWICSVASEAAPWKGRPAREAKQEALAGLGSVSACRKQAAGPGDLAPWSGSPRDLPPGAARRRPGGTAALGLAMADTRMCRNARPNAQRRKPNNVPFFSGIPSRGQGGEQRIAEEKRHRGGRPQGAAASSGQELRTAAAPLPVPR